MNIKAILVIGIFVVVGVVLIVSYVRRRGESFEGTVIDKDVRENINSNNNFNQTSGIRFGNSGTVTHEYMIKVQTDAGKTIHYKISEGKYEIVKIGDRVSKHSGTTDIEIVQATTTPPTTPVAPSPAAPPTIPPTPPVPPTPPQVPPAPPPANTISN